MTLDTHSNTISAIVSQVGGGLQFVTKLYSYTAKDVDNIDS